MKSVDRLTPEQVAKELGYKDVWELIKSNNGDGAFPACCPEFCEVEPDGTCEHGHPSILLALGVI